MSDNKVRVSKTKQRYKQDPKEPKFRMVSKEKAKALNYATGGTVSGMRRFYKGGKV
jgi:hypothetical protein